MFIDHHHVQQVCPFFATKFSLHESSRDSPFNKNSYYARMQKYYHDIEKKRVDNIPEDAITSVKVLMVVTSFTSSLSNLTLLLILLVLGSSYGRSML
jgi:hypothetical protein